MKKWAKLWIFVAWGLALAHALVPHHHHTGSASDACGQNENPVSDFFADIDLGDDHLSLFSTPVLGGILPESPEVTLPTATPFTSKIGETQTFWTNFNHTAPSLRGPPVSA